MGTMSPPFISEQVQSIPKANMFDPPPTDKFIGIVIGLANVLAGITKKQKAITIMYESLIIFL